MLYREFSIPVHTLPLKIKFKEKADTPQYPYRLVIASISPESELSMFLEENNGLIRIGSLDTRLSDLAQLGQIIQSIKPTQLPIEFTFAIPIEDAQTGLEKSFAGPVTQKVQDQLAVINQLEKQPFPVTTLPIRNNTTSFNQKSLIANLPFENQVNNSDVMNANDLKKRVFSIDSRFRSNLEITSATDFIFKLDSPIKNAIRLKLASFEFPYYYYIFSQVRGNVSFIIEYGGNEYVIDISDGAYDLNGGDTDLIKAIQDKLDATFNGPPPNNLGIDFVIQYDPLNGATTISATSGGGPVIFNLDFTKSKYSERQADWGLGYNLGFRKKYYSGLSSYTGEGVIDTTGDPYIFLQINDYSNLEHKLDKGQVVNAFARIQMSANVNTMIFIDSINLLYREIIFQNPQNISFFKIQVVDPYGNIIDVRNMNISMAFEVTQVMNGELYDFYRNYMFQKVNTM